MKKILFSFLILPSIGFTQNCFSKKDAFTGNEIKIGTTYLVSVLAPQAPSFYFMSDGNELFIGFSFSADLKPSDFDTEKMLLLVKFQNGIIKKFTSAKRTAVVKMGNGIMAAFYGNLNVDDLSYFKTNQVSSIRLSYKGDESVGFDTEIANSKAKKIIKSIDCIQ